MASPTTEEMKQLINPGSPFGPASADEFSADRGLAQALYNPRNGIDEALRDRSPVFLIGRRGSGKTAVLNATYPEGELDVKLDTSSLVSGVAKTIEALRLPVARSYAELVVPIWRAAYLAALSARVWSDYCHLTASDCPLAFRFGEYGRKSIQGYGTDASMRFLHAVRQQAPSDFDSVDLMLDNTTVNGVALWEAREDLLRAARRNGCQAMISMDSVDQYSSFLYSGGSVMTRDAFSVQSLWQAASETRRRTDLGYGVRVSFPAELWFHYSKLSTNPLKDFDNSMLLHWSGSEIIRLAAGRLEKFLSIWYPKLVEGRSNSGVPLSPNRYAAYVLGLYLPATVTNGGGSTEPTISYLLRHTQLLPRHAILLLNTIFKDHDFASGQVTNRTIVEAVKIAESIIADGVIDAYDVPHPDLKDVLETLLPGLPIRIEATEILTKLRKNPVGMNADEALQMLIEVGAIGRVLSVDRIYATADFEYRNPSRMYIAEQDVLCVHPIFTEKFRTEYVSDAGRYKPILPIGSDGNSDDSGRSLLLN